VLTTTYQPFAKLKENKNVLLTSFDKKCRKVGKTCQETKRTQGPVLEFYVKYPELFHLVFLATRYLTCDGPTM
jgi:hypothetical protein